MEGKMDTHALLCERQKTHGAFTDHAEITQLMKVVMQDQKSWERLSFCQKESLHMIVHKIGRILAGNANHKDHWDDIAGYAILVAEQCQP
jgi:hypothetical protein